MSPVSIWTWDSCGGARCCGARTPQVFCVDQIRKKHHVGDLVQTASLGKWFPPWTVTRATCNAVLMPKVSGISTDAALFSEHGAQLVHHVSVIVLHASLRGSSMLDLLYFTNRACADAHWAAKRSQTYCRALPNWAFPRSP